MRKTRTFQAASYLQKSLKKKRMSPSGNWKAIVVEVGKEWMNILGWILRAVKYQEFKVGNQKD